MSKPFFYRITAADFLAAVVTVPESDRAAWVLSLALDMVSGDGDKANSQFAKDIIAEAGEYKERRANAGRKGGQAKASNAVAMLDNAVAMPSLPLASSSSSSSSSTVHKPKSLKTNKSSLPENFQVSEAVTKWADKKGYTVTQDDLESFCLHHQKVGSKFVKWDAALQTWMNNKKKFSNDQGSPDEPRNKRLN